jgi:hypothetical protein
MDCCAGMGGESAPPCHCSLNPVPPAPAVTDAARTLVIVPAETPQPAVAVEAPAEASPAVPVPPRARSAPLHLLYSALLV